VPDCDLPRHNGVTAEAQSRIAKFLQRAARKGASCRSDRFHWGNYTLKRSWRVLSGPVVALAIALLAGCATPGPGEAPFSVAVHELAGPDLAITCSRGMQDLEDPDLNGCFNWIGDVCHLYVLPRWVREAREADIRDYHRTLGHELDHCLRGLFHGEDIGVALPRSPALTYRRAF
jgi:hypothetical protein